MKCCPEIIKLTLDRIFFYAKLSAASRATLHRVLTMSRIFSYEMMSGPSQKTLHRVLICSMLTQKYQENIPQDFFSCNVAWSLSDNIVLGFDLCNVVPRALRQYWTGFFLMQCCLEPLWQHRIEFFLCNVVPGVLRQQYTGFFLIQCCLEHLGKHCREFCPVRCCP